MTAHAAPARRRVHTALRADVAAGAFGMRAARHRFSKEPRS
ncbi:hypothetical protein X899_5020 [Burkholderia pseudomallei TSV 25]|nr:hypothetical protein DO64_490 [Burkholderia pseudomallei]KGW16162.1 hypothetical protein X899_5020 [Burkholderia pseudomallei TSV 25]